ncbi:MAG: O-acetyl-ADP-ribose deacetylase [Candidatus Krumholzibacteriota bacterium]|nr:O-acetyl-ADP-ribose deacetylase [Candidatus Krumholzibacteriota bacterium]
MRELIIDQKSLRLKQGDITREEVDAIVNAANPRLAGGGGVDGAIHRAGGPRIMAECDAIRSRQGGCPTGQAVITTAGNLRAKFVIHTAGPVWRGGQNEECRLLSESYSNSMKLAEGNGCRSVAFPSISTGVYNFPIKQAALIALGTLARELTRRSIREVRFILFSPADLRVYEEALSEIGTEYQTNGGAAS